MLPGRAGPHPLALCWTPPVVRRRHRARIGGEAEEEAAAGMPLTHELANVVFAEARHLRRPGVAQVRVVGPDHDPGLPAALAAEVA
jgi:hypothetical protein